MHFLSAIFPNSKQDESSTSLSVTFSGLLIHFILPKHTKKIMVAKALEFSHKSLFIILVWHDDMLMQ